MAWTEAQQKVIDTRNKNLLVSAAAGSGKTAVLVERIISMISEGENPLDIDHLLVVTFTNAAAAEMRDRIGKALDEKLSKNPDNKHLQKQLSLLQSAQITTIHSFCLNVIRNYFHRIDLDPSFKIAEESEMTLMKSDVISDLLECWYEEGREDFHDFIESYSYSKSDAPVEDLILQLYSFSMSSPWPQKWIEAKRSMFALKSLGDMYAAPWMEELLSYVGSVIGDLLLKNAAAIAVCNEPGGPAAYLPALFSDRRILEQIKNAGSYEVYSGLFSSVAYDRLSNKREEAEPWKKEKVKGLREEVKKGLKDLASQFFFQSPEEMLKDLQSVNAVMQVLFDLTLDFMEEFAKKKEEKNLIDFNDLEHFALRILVKADEETGIPGPTQAACELSELFDEILIDEYQDSNMVQETILKSISREDIGSPNRFMVGDVKQSIYKFRLAMPEIFMEKYAAYSIEDMDGFGGLSKYQKINLDMNFRSRKPVLDYVNKIFEQIMQEPVGGIIYDDMAALKYSQLYDSLSQSKDQAGDLDDICNNRLANDVEFLLVTEDEIKKESSENNNYEAPSGSLPADMAEADNGTEQEIEEEAAYTKKELEAKVIAGKIKELTDPEKGMLVMDKKMKVLRPAAYKDIVILLRSMADWSEVFIKTLMAEGIPAYADTGTGYFQSLEIMTILNMLRIIDNPRQDIPLAGVLYSPIVGLSSTELAMIRTADRNAGLYTALIAYISEGRDEELRAKLTGFTSQLDTLRSMVNHQPIHEIIQQVLDHTGYYYFVSAMPGGDQRKANIDMLISQAVRFEKGSYSGLFHFIRYIEKLHKYEVDFGEATTIGEQDNTVRIMSIHKSKGLEFPVVFAAGMGKQFNTQDLRNSIVLHSDLGAGPEYINSRLRTKVSTLLKKVIQKKVQTENLGEELRVLYVAMTRAREKLILTGYLESAEDLQGKDFSFFELMSAKSYMDWVLPAMINRMGKKPVSWELPLLWTADGMMISIIPKSELIKQELEKQIFLLKDEEEILGINPGKTYDSSLRNEVKSRFNYIYPHAKEAGLKIKMTVSELKKMGQFQDEEQSIILYGQQETQRVLPEMVDDMAPGDLTQHDSIFESQEVEATIPAFISRKESQLTGTDRGTLYHKVLELLDLTRIENREDFLKEWNRLVSENLMNQEDLEKLKQDYIYKFTLSHVAGRMKRAQELHKLYKEKQFVIGVQAKEILQDTDSEELILIQGIIDVFFEEDGELVLLDYKSDLVDNAEQLIRRYRIQLEYYRKALEQMLHKKVKDMIIYSLPLAKEIRIE